MPQPNHSSLQRHTGWACAGMPALYRPLHVLHIFAPAAAPTGILTPEAPESALQELSL